MQEIACDIIIPVFNKADMTKACLNSIYEHTRTPFRLTLIDNGSDAGTKRFLKEFESSHKEIALIQNDANLGWVKAVNQGMRLAKSPYICIMNNDTIVRSDGWLAKLMEVAEPEDNIGMVNPRFEAKKETAAQNPYIEIDFCRGYCVLIKRNVIEKIGLLDESYGLGYYDDDDYSVRAIRAGFRCVRANNVIVEHFRDSTFSSIFTDEKRRELHEKNKELFYSKWGKRLNILFIVTKSTAKSAAFSDILFSLARRQHIVYLWRLDTPENFQHINIREKRISNLFYRLYVTAALFINGLKKSSKKYNLVFCDDEKLNFMILAARPGSHLVDMGKDKDRIMELADSVSRF